MSDKSYVQIAREIKGMAADHYLQFADYEWQWGLIRQREIVKIEMGKYPDEHGIPVYKIYVDPWE